MEPWMIYTAALAWCLFGQNCFARKFPLVWPFASALFCCVFLAPRFYMFGLNYGYLVTAFAPLGCLILSALDCKNATTAFEYRYAKKQRLMSVLAIIMISAMYAQQIYVKPSYYHTIGWQALAVHGFSFLLAIVILRNALVKVLVGAMGTLVQSRKKTNEKPKNEDVEASVLKTGIASNSESFIATG